MASKEFEKWLKGQKHKPGDKITNIQRLTSKFLPPAGVTTWGQWYDKTGITPNTITEEPKAKTEEKPKAKKKPLTAGQAKDNVERLSNILGKQRESLKSMAQNDPDYDAVKNAIAKTSRELDAAKTLAKQTLKVETAAKTKKTTEEELKYAEQELQYAKDGGDKKEIQAASNALAIARNAAIKAGVTNPDGSLIGSTAVGGKIGTPIPSAATGPTGPTGSAGAAGSNGTSGGKKTGSTGSGNKGVKAPTDAEQKNAALDVAATDFALPETIFNNVPSLKRLLERYVAEDWTPEKLRKEIRDDNWFRKNSQEIKARYVQLYNYQDLVKTGQADGSTDYEKQITTLERKLADKARQVGSGLASDPAALRKAAENMYITNVGIDDPMTTDFIAAAIRPVTSTLGGKITEGYSGQALKDYQDIQAIAKANGFKVSDILPGGANEQQVLQGLAKGTIDANRLAQDARKLAAQGQPQYVRDLLGQGYNLDQVFSPYKNTMASILEINPDEIDLNDPTLRNAITDKGDMNIYDFKKQLKADSRWQYTENAKKEVADSALSVLRDFGFQG